MSSRSTHESGQRLGQMMHRLGGALAPSPDDVVGIDIPRQQLKALFIVAKHGPMSVGALAEATHASLASTSSLAERLVKAGHLQREPDPHDRRRVLLLVTPQGREVADKLMQRFYQRFERLVEAMTPEGRAALEVGLNDMIRAAEELGLRTEPGHHHEHGDHV